MNREGFRIMKRKVGKRKKQLQQKYFFRKLLLTEGILIIAAVIILGGVFLVKRIRENVNTVSMVEEASGLDMDDSNSLAAVKAAMARPAEFSPKCVDSTSPSLYIETTDIEVDGQILANTSDYTSTDTHSFDAGISYTDVDGIVTFRGNNFRDTAAYGNTQIKMEKSRISGQQKPALLLTAMPPGPEAAGPDSLLWKNGPKK